MTTNNDLSKVWPEWQIEEQLGKGSYGVVYKAVRRDHNVESWAAIKVISIPSDPSEVDSLRSEGMDMDDTRTYLQGIVDDFVSEIQLMESLKGIQNIVSVEDYKVVEKTDELGWDIYIRMELLTPFNTYICDKELTEADVIKLGCDICIALERCNERNVIHRDIKPENIFINDFGDFKLGDFGIARKMENLTGGLSLKGTYNYMAPEVKNSVNYDARVDTYSLGIVLYRLLNDNLLPFLEKKQLRSPNERVLAVERRMQGEALSAPCDASPAMANLILRACAYNPNMRFDSATEMKEALMSVSAGTYPVASVSNQGRTISVRRASAGYDITTAVRKTPINNTLVEATPKKRNWTKIIVMILISFASISIAVLGYMGHVEKQENIAAIIDAADALANAENYKDALDELQDGLEKFPKSTDMQDKIDEYTIELEKQEISAIVAEADKLANDVGYDEALEKIQAGLAIYPKAEVLQKKIEEYTNALNVQIKEETLAEADTLAESGDYISAMTLIQNAQDSYGNDTDYQRAYDVYNQAYITMVKTDAINASDGLAQSGDYVGAMESMNKSIALIGKDLELLKKLSEYENLFVEDEISKANNLLESSGYDEAIKSIDAALDVLPNNEELVLGKAEIEIHKPVAISEMHVVEKQYYENGVCTDTYGNTYTSAFTIGSAYDWKGKVVFNMNREYTTLTFVLAPAVNVDSTSCKLQVCTDDKVIYAETVVATTEPQKITLDITGCSLLKFERLDGGGIWGDAVIIGEPYVQK